MAAFLNLHNQLIVQGKWKILHRKNDGQFTRSEKFYTEKKSDMFIDFKKIKQMVV